MNSSLYKSLYKCDAKEAWYSVKEIVCAQLMGKNTFGVPYLEEASTYNAGYVVLKEARSTMEKLGRRTPAAIPVGLITDFVCENDEMSCKIAKELLNSAKDDKGTLNQNYIFSEYDMKNGLKKEIVVKIEECTKRELKGPVDHFRSAMAFSRRGYQHLQKFYLIPCAFYASKISVRVSFNDQVDEITIDKKIPVGFKLWKYEMDQVEYIAASKGMVDPDKWKVLWIQKRHFRNPMDKLPDIPVANFQNQDHTDEDAEGYITLPGSNTRAN